MVPGWASSEQAWREALNQAMGAPSIIQRRIRVLPELCPGEVGELVPWEATWGVFSSPTGFGGVFTKAFQMNTGHAVAQIGLHLRVGCCLVQEPAPPAAG